MNEKTKILQQCPECDFKATRKENIKLHILRIHRKEFRFKCSQCPKQYAINSELSFHIQSCHKDKSLQCPHCDATYSVKKYLNTHIKLNHNPDSVKKKKEKNRTQYYCPLCDKQFSFQMDMKKHVKAVHEGININVINVTF